MAVFSEILHHFQKEPVVTLSNIFNSLLNTGDISEGMFFYFTELSLTACFVIVIVLAARLLLKKAPKVYSYALWGIVFLKLMFPFSITVPQQTIVPAQQIDTVYDSVMPQHNFFYDSNVGFESIVVTDNLADVPVTDPVFYPALIWFVVFVLLLVVSAIRMGMTYTRLYNSSYTKLEDNIYIADISTPFVLGVIKPKIYLPKNLTEQEKTYVITHEKVHLKRFDHIVKLVCFTVCCIHWFNPLVWISFFLMEKDMEMSCDEKVLDILGSSHKKDYSYCILSLSTGRRFLPKAYLSFGDSDTERRIKNVLKFSKPSRWIAAFAAIVIILAAVGALSENEGGAVAEVDILTAAKGEFGYFHLTVEDYDSTIEFRLPKNWYFEERTEADSINGYDYFPVVLVNHVYDIYNEDDIAVGAFGIAEQPYYEPYIDDVMAIYGPFTLSNNFSFQVKGEDYYQISDFGFGTTGICSVYHSPSIVHNNGGLGEAVYNRGIVVHNRQQLVIAAFEFDKDVLSDEQQEFIAASMTIEEQDSPVAGKKEIAEFVYQTEQINMYHQIANRFGLTVEEIKTIYLYRGLANDGLLLTADLQRAHTVLEDILDGQDYSDMLEKYKKYLYDLGFEDGTIKSLANRGNTMIEVYLMTEEQVKEAVSPVMENDNPDNSENNAEEKQDVSSVVQNVSNDVNNIVNENYNPIDQSTIIRNIENQTGLDINALIEQENQSIAENQNVISGTLDPSGTHIF